MLTRRDVYPYIYMDSFSRFDEQQLPHKEAFYSDLSKENIKEEDYLFAQNLWKTFDLKNLGELHDLYMESDVVLLADVFENWILICTCFLTKVSQVESV